MARHSRLQCMLLASALALVASVEGDCPAGFTPAMKKTKKAVALKVNTLADCATACTVSADCKGIAFKAAKKSKGKGKCQIVTGTGKSKKCGKKEVCCEAAKPAKCHKSCKKKKFSAKACKANKCAGCLECSASPSPSPLPPPSPSASPPPPRTEDCVDKKNMDDVSGLPTGTCCSNNAQCDSQSCDNRAYKCVTGTCEDSEVTGYMRGATPLACPQLLSYCAVYDIMAVCPATCRAPQCNKSPPPPVRGEDDDDDDNSGDSDDDDDDNARKSPPPPNNSGDSDDDDDDNARKSPPPPRYRGDDDDDDDDDDA